MVAGVVVALLTFGAVATADDAVDAVDAADDIEALAPHDRVFVEARRALAARDPQTALHLWLLHRAMPWDDGFTREGEFLSTTWVAAGDSGVCPEGLPDDVDGARLWPIALHNWILRRVRRGPPADLPPMWPTFSLGLQTRPISLFDTLSLEELRTARLVVGPCNAHRWVQARLPTLQWLDLEDRLSVGLVVHDLLELAETTTDPTQVRGLGLLPARRFDLEVAMTRLARDRAKAATDLAAQALRATGLAPDQLTRWQQERGRAFATGTRAGLWTTAARWPATTWLDLPDDRRVGLFLDARDALRVAGTEERLVLDVLRGLIDRRDGAAAERWLGAVNGLPTAPLVRTAILTGPLGADLLTLDAAAGFRERAVVALHRGVERAQSGAFLDALRLLAEALTHAETSSAGPALHDLTLRWFAFVVGSYATTDEVLAVIERFVPPGDHAVVLEAVLWRALFHADRASFERAYELLPKGARALRANFALLAPLAAGDVDAAFDAWGAAVVEKPRAMLDLAARLLARLASEPITLRARHEETLRRLLDELPRVDASSSTRRKLVERLTSRAQAMLEAAGRARDEIGARARDHDPDFEADAGALRLAPIDALPWPFVLAPPRPVDPFAPLLLVPVQWRDADGRIVDGWSLRE
jgi:hypothetical protein